MSIRPPDQPHVTAQILRGDCGLVLAGFPNDCVDLIMTSPPYAGRRGDLYQGCRPDDYVEWFLPKAAQFRRVLKPSGTFILNLKECVVDGERHTYIIDLVKRLRDEGWLWTEEFIWHKKNTVPGRWPNRFRDAWERCLQFNKQRDFKMRQNAVMVPVGDWAKKRLANLSDTDTTRQNSATKSGFGRRIANWEGRDLVYPTNVLHMAGECGNQGHGAAFPVALPTWFIRLFTDPGDYVLDPFVGSGTTLVAATQLGRNSVGIDTEERFCDLARARLQQRARRRLELPSRGERLPL